MPSAVPAVLQLAATQHGLFTAAQAAEQGMSRQVVASLQRRGAVERVHRGVYRVGGVPPSWRGGVMAAVLAGGPRVVASHGTALALHGLADESERIEVCSPTLWHPERSYIWVHQTTSLPSRDVAAIDGIPSTRGERTVIDSAVRRSRPGITQLVDEAICAGVCVRRRLYRRAVDLRNGRAGVGLICRLTHPDAAAEFRSWLERRAASDWRLRGVPSPAWNVPVSDARGKIGEVDALWAWRPLIVELEGLRFHTTPAQRRRDAGRFNRLTAVARVLRYTWHDIVERPEHCAAEIMTALGDGGAATLSPLR